MASGVLESTPESHMNACQENGLIVFKEKGARL
jgi:hypothetical protein